MNTTVFFELEDVRARVQIPNVDGILVQRGGHNDFLKHGEEYKQSTVQGAEQQTVVTYSFLLQLDL